MLTFVLLDFENVQPNDLGRLREAHIRVFLGPHQTKLPVTLVASLQPLGDNVQYIPFETAGKNALDFRVAYELGHLSATNPTASFEIVSKDAGFDPLITHLRAKGIQVRRSTTVGQESKHLERAIDYLTRRKASMPRALKTLLSTLRALFRDEPLSEGDLTALVVSLQDRGIVKIEGGKVSYQLPRESAQTGE